MLTPANLAALEPWIDHWHTCIRTAGLAESADYWGLIHELHDPELTWSAFLGVRARLTRDYYLDSATVSGLSRLHGASPEPFEAILRPLVSASAGPDAMSVAEQALQVLAKAVDLEIDGREKIERTLAAYLTLRAPDRHCFYLGAARLGVARYTGANIDDGYAGWRALALDLAEHLRAQPDLVQDYRAALTPDDYRDEGMLLAAYDLLFCGSRLSGLGTIDPLTHIPYPEAVGKVSMSASAVPDEVYREARRRRVVLVHADTRAKGRSAETQAETFSSFRKNDWFYLCRGNERIELLGRFLTDEAVPSELRPNGDANWLERPYMRIGYPAKLEPYRGASRWWTPNDNSTCTLVPREAWREMDELIFEPFFGVQPLADVEAYLARTVGPNATLIQSNTHAMHPLNQILYGPPGTGKTYATRKIAVEICDGREVTDRAEVRRRYDALVAAGRILFATFHQSMSYEDFVEGIKPEVMEGGQVSYGVEDGVFKRMAVEAQYQQWAITNETDGRKGQSFIEAFEALIYELEASEDVDALPTIESKTGREYDFVNITEQGNVQIKPRLGGAVQTILKGGLIKLNQVFPDLNEISGSFQHRFREHVGGYVSGYWALLSLVQKRKAVQAAEFSVMLYEDKKTILGAYQSSALKSNNIGGPGGSPVAAPHVLIVDEINRGNVAAIFGELITLLEKDKRLGADEELTVTLPYSKERFGVPDNLFLIGTMNTTDRSVEALDAALRRRFEFTEVCAKPEVITKVAQAGHGLETIDVAGFSVSLPDLLITINSRVELLRDRHHHIGHSYFLGLDDAQDLRTAMERKVIPLLQEYFFGEDDKLELILGSKFCWKVPPASASPFAPGVTSDYADLRELVRYTVAVPQEDSDFRDAFERFGLRDAR